MAAAPSYPTRMAFRIMLRISEALSLRRTDLRLTQDPPVISVRPAGPGNKARKGREVPIPADLLESCQWRRKIGPLWLSNGGPPVLRTGFE